MELEAVVHEVAETIQREANVQAVFGQPIKLDEHTVIPVALVTVSVGGGGGGFLSRVAEKAAQAAAGGSGGGGGAGFSVSAVPLGFLSERDGQVVYSPIEIHEAEGRALPAKLIDKILQRMQKAA